MSLSWTDREIRPAGVGPMEQEFIERVSESMRSQNYKILADFVTKVSRAQRGCNWRAWLTWFAVGFSGGAMGAIIAHWMR